MTRHQNQPDPVAQAKMIRALELYKQGWQLQPICDEVGWKSIGTASRRMRAEMRKQVAGAAEDAAAVIGARLDAVLAAFWDAMARGDKDAAEVVLKVTAQQRALYGADHAKMRELEDARRALSGETGLLVAAVINRIVGRLDLTPGQRAVFPQVAAEELRRVLADAPMLEGETVDDEGDEGDIPPG